MPSADARVILSHQDALRQVRERVARYAADRWRALPDYRDDSIERFISQIVPMVESGQKRTAQLTNAYLDSLARLAGMPPPPKAALPTDLRGVPLAEVYRRPAVTVYTALAEGKSFPEAVELGAQRLQSLVNMDLQMANVRASYERLSQDDRVVGYERVLDGGENCALCAIASTQLYSRQDLMEIHLNCHCTVATVYKSTRKSVSDLNDAAYQAVSDQLKEQGLSTSDLSSGSGGNKELMRKVRVNIHGEYGPVLGWASQNFTSASDI